MTQGHRSEICTDRLWASPGLAPAALSHLVGHTSRKGGRRKKDLLTNKTREYMTTDDRHGRRLGSQSITRQDRHDMLCMGNLCALWSENKPKEREDRSA